MNTIRLSTAASAVALCFALSSGAASAATTTVLDFEAFTDFDVLLADQFSGQGVTFDGPLGISAFGDPSSGVNVASNASPFGGDISGTFSTAMNTVSVFAGDASPDVDTVVLRVFDADGNVLGADTFTGANAQWLSVSSVGDIMRFEILQFGLVGIDDFTFTTVPVPASLPLLLAGLGGLAVMRRGRAR